MRVVVEEYERARVVRMARDYGLRTTTVSTHNLVRSIEAAHRRMLESEERAEMARRSLAAAEAEREARIWRRSA